MISLLKKGLYPFVVCIGLAITTSCSKNESYEFSLPSGPATMTLKMFATQAGIEILFDSEQIRGERTYAVEGKMTPEQTLTAMLKDTSLRFHIDPQSHAFAVINTEVPQPALSK